MKLMSTDVRHFHACVYKIFEDSNWEIRYQGLDNLYGLFTKMDAAFQTKWLPMLSYLGPVFSYFVGSLWDKEEYVRAKAFALIRTFGTLHLRSAFRCWEAYFLTATDRQRTSVIKLMIQLNALFPDWQVIQWESLLEALEAKQNDKADTQSFDILERYMRTSSSNARHHDDNDGNRNSNTESEIEQENEDMLTIEIENARVLMLTLALQMLGSNLPVDTVQISRLKYILVDCMGFNNCRRYVTSGEWVVTFGSMTYDPANPLQNSFLIAASRGLKKIMDSFAPLPAETVASMAPDVLEQNRVELAENSSPGVHFIDVVLKLFNSGVDVTSLNHMMLKIWLETILIVMYKHNILEREFEHSIVNCMKQIIELLTKEISEENKLLILEILKCLLRRSDHLTAMVLSKQIMALGKLMTKLGNKMSEPVFLKAKEFLKSAFLRFAVAGLFVLMFKNQTVSDSNNRDVDLFFVLRTVIDPEDVVPDEDMHEIVYLRDQPVRDVLDKLMKQQMERKAFSTVLHNMCRYVETVHSHPYSESILNDYAIFLNTLTKHTAGWRRPEWDINPLFTMSAILLKEHPYHYAILLPQIQNLFRHGLQHCTINVENVVELLASYTVLISIPGASPDNVFVQIITEEVKNGLNSRTKLHKDTMLVLLELILWDSKPDHEGWFAQVEQALPGEHPTATASGGYRRVRYFDASLPSLLEPLGFFLKLPPASQQFTKKDFKTYNTVAELLVNLCVEDNSNLYRIFGMQKLDETRHCLRFLSWFLLAILREPSTSLLLVEFEDTIIELLVQTFNSIPIDFDTPDLNFSYSPAGESLVLSFLIVKAWVLLILRWEDNRPTFWMSLWPALRRLLSRIDPETLSVAGNIGLSVWNLLLSLLQFLFACRSPVIMHSNGQAAQELMTLNEFRNQVQHIQRMFVTPPVQVPLATLNDQLFLELRDVMRLQAETIMFQSSKAFSSTANGM
ncbi:hypothetical protein BDB00DRAFT_754914 [Zychaea mexicana]|uniref:uncharacterized protein n=1 Tax=Zychaea mexicana TaxID=64656 RepID=UPI0022FE234A|nr:uncharacterized protein BDB00DRAFT_754914 [Zychaea mexicana]KAI9498426.1 hypothetical protein BDB00DRAFT_754914 [Zychaea mexicana]